MLLLVFTGVHCATSRSQNMCTLAYGNRGSRIEASFTWKVQCKHAKHISEAQLPSSPCYAYSQPANVIMAQPQAVSFCRHMCTVLVKVFRRHCQKLRSHNMRKYTSNIALLYMDHELRTRVD